MTGAEMLGLAAAAAAAGAINAVAGGGTLVTFPSLLAFGVSPVTANATSTVALVIGTAGSVFGYRAHLGPIRPWLRTFLPVSLLGGLVGSCLVTVGGDRLFSRLVPFLVLFATVLFTLQGVVRRRLDRVRGTAEASGDAPPRPLPALAFQFVVAVYGGYFGAGIGILMLATLGFLGLRDIHRMNTVKTVLGSLINVVAAGWFIAAGLVDWPRAAVMTVGAVSGYYLASRYAQRIPQQAVRLLITVIGIALFAATFYAEFIRK